MSLLHTPLKLRDVNLKNRLAVSPMCMYSAQDGHANNFHLVHLGRFALGGAGLVIAEATAVSPEGRISPRDLGLWDDAHTKNLGEVVDFLKEHGAVAGVQLAHAGRKASTYAPFDGRGGLPEHKGAWQTLGAGDERYNEAMPVPRAMDADDIAALRRAFRDATRRAVICGFEAVEIHAAHGYLLHQFLSPLTNRRSDAYGGDFAGRTRLLLEVTEEVRGAWPNHLPLFVRLSATDWVEGGWDIDETVELSRELGRLGVDVIDVSSGGLHPDQKIPVQPGYQVAFAERIRREAGVRTMAVGLITEARQAETILQSEQADLIAIGRQFLRDPNFALRSSEMLEAEVDWLPQLERGQPIR